VKAERDGSMATREQRKIERLAAQLFRMVEKSQGYFYVSDGETAKTVDALFAKVRMRLQHGEEAVSQMKTFLALHGELKD
jgi:hypothetical protein